MKRLLVGVLCVLLLVPELAVAAAALRSSSSLAYGSRTNSIVTAPAGIQNGDVLLYTMFLGITGTAITATPPTGFVACSGGTFPIALTDGSFNARAYVWYKIASSESGDYTSTHTAGSSSATMLAISGGTGTPACTTNNGTGGTTTATGLTTSANDSLVAFVGWDWADTANNVTPPTGATPTFSEVLDLTITYVATGVLATAGATGDKTITNNSTGGHAWGGVLVAVEAAGGGASEVFGFLKRRPQ